MARRKHLFFVGRTITRAEVAADPRYQLVASEGDGVGALYVSRTALGDKNRSSRLAEYYRRTKPDMVAMVRKSAIAMEPGSVVIAPFPIAAGYLVLRADGVMSAELEAVTSSEVLATAERWPDRLLYVVGGLLPGRSGHQVDEFSLRGKKIPLMLIEPERAR